MVTATPLNDTVNIVSGIMTLSTSCFQRFPFGGSKPAWSNSREGHFAKQKLIAVVVVVVVGVVVATAAGVEAVAVSSSSSSRSSSSSSPVML